MQVSSIATNAKRIIEKRGLKKKAIAITAGYSEKQLSSLLNGRKVIKDSDVIALAIALGVSPNDLFGWDEEIQSRKRAG